MQCFNSPFDGDSFNPDPQIMLCSINRLNYILFVLCFLRFAYNWLDNVFPQDRRPTFAHNILTTVSISFQMLTKNGSAICAYRTQKVEAESSLVTPLRLFPRNFANVTLVNWERRVSKWPLATNFSRQSAKTAMRRKTKQVLAKNNYNLVRWSLVPIFLMWP